MKDNVGIMSCEVVDFSENGIGEFSITVKVSKNQLLSTSGLAVIGDDDMPGITYIFHDENFNHEIMKGNIDIRTLCGELTRRANR